MKMIWQILLTPLAALMLSSVHAECAIPRVITVPDGATATEEEMVAGKATVNQYMANGYAYLDCIEAEEAALGDEMTDEQHKLSTQLFDNGVDALETMAARFNAEIKAFYGKSE